MQAGKNVVLFEAFEDFGNAPEFVVDGIAGFELIENGLVRVFATRTYRGKKELAYTAVLSLTCLSKIAMTCMEVTSATKASTLAFATVSLLAS